MKTRLLLLLVISGGLIAGCRSVDHLMDTGEYDDVITKAHKKLRGKKNKPDKYVLAIEEAFEEATARDMRRIEVLKQRGSSADWKEIIDIAYRIDSRQDLVRPYLPLIAKEGYKASFTFVKSNEIIDVAHANMVTRLYEEGVELVSVARNGDKIAARNAYEVFDRLLNYTDNYRDAHTLRQESRDLGINHVRIVQRNEANAWIPEYVTKRLLDRFALEDDFWTRFHFGAGDGRKADIEAILTLTEVEAGPPVSREDITRRSRRIQDGWDYVFDERGNVAKDSLGNDIKSIRYRTVRADVVRTTQEKVAYVRAEFKAIDLNNGSVIATKPLTGTARFIHTAQWYVGDERALRGGDQRYVALQPFPSNEQLIIEAADALKPIFLKELKRKYYAS